MYRQVVQHTSYINEHCSTLRRLAMDCDRVTEVVDRVGPSTVALLSGRPDKVTSYVRSTEQFGKLAAFSRGMNHEITIDADMWLPDRPHETSLLFIGACKTSADLAAVLKNCETWSSRWLVVAGLATYGDTGADGQPGMNLAMGEFLRAHTRWTAVEAHPYNNGLHVFSCDSKDKREVPSWWTSAKNYTKARFKYEMAGEPDVDEAVYDLRLHACLMCPHRNGDICSICTCPVDDKALWATEDCPDKPSRWPSLTVLSDKKEEIKPQTAEKSVKSLEEQEMDTLRAALASKTPSVTHCRHQNVTSEVEITSGETITAAIQIRCMDCSTIFSFKDRPGDPKPVFQLSTLA
jgi:hypothetical protein